MLFAPNKLVLFYTLEGSVAISFLNTLTMHASNAIGVNGNSCTVSDFGAEVIFSTYDKVLSTYGKSCWDSHSQSAMWNVARILCKVT
jgi:hypothetical protein